MADEDLMKIASQLKTILVLQIFSLFLAAGCSNSPSRNESNKSESGYQLGCYDFLGQRIKANYINVEGFANIGGDMLLPINQIQDCDSPNAIGLTGAPGINSRRIWPNKRVPFALPQNFPYTTELNAAISQWAASGIKWEPKTDADKDYVNFVLLPATDPKIAGACGTAILGLFSGVGPHNITLRTRETQGTCAPVLLRTLLHEMGHIMGFHHEHQRSDRDDHIVFSSDVSQNPNLQKLVGTVHLSPFDLSSIMMYSTSQIPGLRTKAGAVISINNALSAADIAGARKLYENIAPKVSIKPTFERNQITNTPFNVELLGEDDSQLSCTEAHWSWSSAVMVQKPTVSWSGAWPNCQARVTTAPLSLGTLVMNFELFDGIEKRAASTVVTISPVNNHPPVIEAVADQFTGAGTVKFVSVRISDADGPKPCNAYSARFTDSNSLLDQAYKITGWWSGDYPNCRAELKPNGTASGKSDVTITLIDGNHRASVKFRFFAGRTLGDPVIDANPTQSTTANVPLVIPLTLSNRTPLTCSSTHLGYRSSNPLALAPTGQISWGGVWPNCIATVTPAETASGSTALDLTLSDGNTTDSTRVTLNVIAALPRPILWGLDTLQTTTMNTVKTTSFMARNLPSTWRCSSDYLAYTSSQPQVVAASGAIQWSGMWPNCIASINPVSNAIGSAIITIMASDGQRDRTATSSFTLSVSATNPVQPSGEGNNQSNTGSSNSGNGEPNRQQQTSNETGINRELNMLSGQKIDLLLPLPTSLLSRFDPNSKCLDFVKAEKTDQSTLLFEEVLISGSLANCSISFTSSKNALGTNVISLNTSENSSNPFLILQLNVKSVLASIVADKVTGKAPIWINFSGDKSNTTSDEKIIQYEWNFGDGSGGRAKNFSKSFTQPGEYEITLKIKTQSGKEDSEKIKIKIEN